MTKVQHTLRCTDQDSHGQHVWADGESRWWCVGTDPVAAVNSTNERTLDGVLIRHGMTAFDYNLDECRVTGVQSMSGGTVWFETTTGMFDGTRLWARMPRSGR
jgi:hypothetical protein